MFAKEEWDLLATVVKPPMKSSPTLVIWKSLSFLLSSESQKLSKCQFQGFWYWSPGLGYNNESCLSLGNPLLSQITSGTPIHSFQFRFPSLWLVCSNWLAESVLYIDNHLATHISIVSHLIILYISRDLFLDILFILTRYKCAVLLNSAE